MDSKEAAWDVEEAADISGADCFGIQKGIQIIALCATREDADYVASALNAFELMEEG